MVSLNTVVELLFQKKKKYSLIKKKIVRPAEMDINSWQVAFNRPEVATN